MANLHNFSANKVSEVILQKPCNVFKVNNGGIRFTIKIIPEPRGYYKPWKICLIDKECPHQLVYTISFNYQHSCIYVYQDEDRIFDWKMPQLLLDLDNDILNCWLTWYCDTIEIGVVNDTKLQKPFFIFKGPNRRQRIIGFVKFINHNHNVNLAIDTGPVLTPISCRKVEGGQLRWVKMTDGGTLPEDALIGGFENEPLYIARAMHNRSLCPGKYVRSKNKAYVPWGNSEHEKNIFEILCGYDAIWVKCKDNFVPENVFKAGSSEVRGEDIYIGRAMIEDNLIVGKVHMLYKTCYLPYHGREFERYSYEILVTGNTIVRGVTINENCIMNPLRALQPCI